MNTKRTARYLLLETFLFKSAISALLILPAFFTSPSLFASAQGINKPCVAPPTSPTRVVRLVPEIPQAPSAPAPRGVFFENKITLDFVFGRNDIICLSSQPNAASGFRVDDQIALGVIRSNGQAEYWVQDFYDPRSGGIGQLPAQDISVLFGTGSNSVSISLRDYSAPTYSSNSIWLLIWQGATPTPTEYSTPQLTKTTTPTPTRFPIATPTQSPAPLTPPGLMEVAFPSAVIVGRTEKVTLKIAVDMQLMQTEARSLHADPYSIPPESKKANALTLEERIGIYPQMSAELVGAKLAPNPKENLRRSTSTGSAAWSWDVTGEQVGDQLITLNLYGEGDERNSAPSIEKLMTWKITVVDKPLGEKLLEWIANNLAILIGTGGPFGLIIAYLAYRATRATKALEERLKAMEEKVQQSEQGGTTPPERTQKNKRGSQSKN